MRSIAPALTPSAPRSRVSLPPCGAAARSYRPTRLRASAEGTRDEPLRASSGRPTSRRRLLAATALPACGCAACAGSASAAAGRNGFLDATFAEAMAYGMAGAMEKSTGAGLSGVCVCMCVVVDGRAWPRNTRLGVAVRVWNEASPRNTRLLRPTPHQCERCTPDGGVVANGTQCPCCDTPTHLRHYFAHPL